jgi:hypothetical protein
LLFAKKNLEQLCRGLSSWGINCGRELLIITRFCHGPRGTGEDLQLQRLHSSPLTMPHPECARVAEAEGFDRVAAFFHYMFVTAQNHEKRGLALLENLTNGNIFKSKDTWKMETPEAPNECPTLGIVPKNCRGTCCVSSREEARKKSFFDPSPHGSFFLGGTGGQ